jgi:hypothetical protein
MACEFLTGTFQHRTSLCARVIVIIPPIFLYFIYFNIVHVRHALVLNIPLKSRLQEECNLSPKHVGRFSRFSFYVLRMILCANDGVCK